MQSIVELIASDHHLVVILLTSVVLFFALVISLVAYILTSHSTAKKQLVDLTNRNNALSVIESDLIQRCGALDTQVESLQKELVTSGTKIAVLEKERDISVQQITSLRENNSDSQEKVESLKTSFAELEARTAAEKASLEEKLSLLQENRQALTKEFELLAAKIFDDKTKQFNNVSKTQLDATLSPFKEQLESFRKRVDAVHAEDNKERHSLKEEVKRLREDSLRISEDAANLTNALTFDNKTQGNWGELTLTRALEICGLREPEEYETQKAFSDENSKRQIPDVIVHLPGGKDIIIDSKVSLTAYTRYFASGDEQEKQQALAEHVQSVRQHVKSLSEKSYQQLDAINTLDYVMLYIPIEGASLLALQSDKLLWEEAYAKNIVLVSPTNLLAILRSVESIWRREKQNENAKEIARQAGNLHDKLVTLSETFETVGRHIDSAQGAYDKAFGQLISGRGNLVQRVKNLQKLGAKTSKNFSDKLLQQADTELQLDHQETSVASGANSESNSETQEET